MVPVLNDLLIDLRGTFILILGALIGILGSVVIWHKQNREERRRRRAELLLRTIELTYSTGTYTRCLIYSKIDGIKGVLHLPENPVDKIMSIVLIHFPEACPYVQTLHEQQQALFGHRTDIPDASAFILAIGEKISGTMNDIIHCLQNLAEKEKLNG
jgi:hypothetical protein